MAQTIDTRANVKVRLGITTATDDTLLDALLETAAGLMSNYVGGRTWPAAAVADIVEYFRGNTRFLFVTRPPITDDGSLAVKVDSNRGWGSDITALSKDVDFVLDAANGILQTLNPSGMFMSGAAPLLRGAGGLSHWSDNARVVKVTYKGDGPADDVIKEALALTVNHLYRDIKTDVDQAWRFNQFDSRSSVQVQRVMDGSRDPLLLPPYVRSMLAHYRRYPV